MNRTRARRAPEGWIRSQRSRGLSGLNLWVIAGLLTGACATQSPPIDPEPPVAPPAERQPAASPGEPAATERPAEPAEAPVAPAPVGSAEVWRFTTLVTGGPDPLIGANGYYELVLDGDRVTVRKIGVRGTPQLPAERVMEGTGKLTQDETPAWPAAWSGTVTVTLADAKSKQRMSLSLAVIGDELHGTWLHPGDRGRAWGLLQGTRGRGEPLALVDGELAPCSICNEAFFACDGVGAGACNSSNVAMEDCGRRLRSARKKGAEVPRGCGDWMRKGG